MKTEDNHQDNPTRKEFLKDVDSKIDDFKNKYAGNHIHISDLFDDEGNQYVDLVQKGGGVWGVALIGFTYVLETFNIRFLRMAGTSAGAINTVLMTVIGGSKKVAKSNMLLDILLDKKLIDFVDGHKFVKKALIFLTNKSDVKKSISPLLFTYFILALLSILGIIYGDLCCSFIPIISYWLLVILLVLFAGIISFLIRLWNRFNQAGLGLNPGEAFLFWLKDLLNDYKEKIQNANLSKGKNLTIDDLKDIANNVDDLNLQLSKERSSREQQEFADELNSNKILGDVCVITSELVTQNKIELPEMLQLFKRDDGKNPLDGPAELVRASMSIPFFFESFYVRNINKSYTTPYWHKFFGQEPPKEARLVDGGLMSNFPVYKYFNPNIDSPRWPTIGINLTGEVSNKNKLLSDSWSFGMFLGKLFETARSFYDKDFVLRNASVKAGITDVYISEISWLKFNLSIDDKKNLFMSGASAALKFLEKCVVSGPPTETKDNMPKVDEPESENHIDSKPKELLLEESFWNKYKNSRKEYTTEIKENPTIDVKSSKKPN